MLLIFGALNLGGVETFFIRLSKQRFREGKNTKMVLLSSRDRSDKSLIAEAAKYAELYFYEDLTIINNLLVKKAPFHVALLLPLKKEKISQILSAVSHIHVSTAFCGYFAERILSIYGVDCTLSIGLYHSTEFCWGEKGTLPYFEGKNREFFYKKLNDGGLVFFNESCVQIYEKYAGVSFELVNLFPLGVVELNDDKQYGYHPCPSEKKIKLVSVGRLVAFKSYNMWMIDVVLKLKKHGIDVVYYVFGEGSLMDEMKSKIENLSLEENVILAGCLDYTDFSRVVSSFDVFIGSGTAIIESSSLGVPSVVGIEGNNQPYSYGFFSEIDGFSYNEDNLFPKRSVFEILLNFMELSDEEKKELSCAHKVKSMLFSMDSCSVNFDELKKNVGETVLSPQSFFYFRFLYSMSFLFFSLKQRMMGTTLSDLVRVCPRD